MNVGPEVSSLNFLLSYGIACNNYVASRVALKSGHLVPGCLLAQQFVEICTKATLRLYHQEIQQRDGKTVELVLRSYRHRIYDLMKSEEVLITSFSKVTSIPELVNFLNFLSDIYLYGRFGERPVSGNPEEVIRLLDRMARILLGIHAEAIKYNEIPRLYVADHERSMFLEGNIEFAAGDITNNPVSSIFPFPGELPSLPSSL